MSEQHRMKTKLMHNRGITIRYIIDQINILIISLCIFTHNIKNEFHTQL